MCIVGTVPLGATHSCHCSNTHWDTSENEKKDSGKRSSGGKQVMGETRCDRGVDPRCFTRSMVPGVLNSRFNLTTTDHH